MSGRNLTLDGLRLCMAACVVGIHTALLAGRAPILSWLLSEGVFRAAVPVFLVINGYFLSGAITRHRAGTWLRRLAMLYLLWSAIYAPIWLADVAGAPNPAEAAVVHIAFGYFHLWYLAAALQGAVLLLLIGPGRHRMLGALALGLYACGVLAQDLALWGMLPESWTAATTDRMFRNFLFLGFPFLALGHLLAALDIRLSAPHAALAAAVGLALVLGEALVNMRLAPGATTDLMFGQLVLAPALVLLAMAIPLHGAARWPATVATVVYFVHPLVILLARALQIGGDKRFVFVLGLSGLAGLASAWLARVWRRS